MAQNPFYVYALKDPRQKPAKPFYIGKGTGNRAWEHQAKIDESEKGLLIKEILEASHSVIHTIIADNLTEQQALLGCFLRELYGPFITGLEPANHAPSKAFTDG